MSPWELHFDVHFPFDPFVDCVFGQHAHHMLACSVNSHPSIHCVMTLSMSVPKQELNHNLVNLTIYSGFRISCIIWRCCRWLAPTTQDKNVHEATTVGRCIETICCIVQRRVKVLSYL